MTMRFTKAKDIKILNISSEPLPGFREGYRCGVFTIHRDPTMGNWILSAQGVRLLGAWKLETAKEAAKAFAATRVNWSAPMVEIQAQIKNDSTLARELREVRDTYTPVFR
jgi:hypothetical protein